MSNENKVTLESAHEIAKKHYQSGNLTLADITYKDILKVFPDDFDSLYYLSIINYYSQNYEESLKFIKQAIAVNDNNAESWNICGILLAQLEQKKEALKKFKHSIKLKPDFAEGHSNLGNAYWELGEHKKALKACQKAIEIKPDYFEAYVNLGNAYVGMGQPGKAIELWKKSLEIAPNNANAHINIANALRDLGKTAESGEHCEKALELSPEHPKALLNYGNVKRDQGSYKEAEELYRKATLIEPNYVEAHNNLSVALLDLHRYDEAITSIKFSLALYPKQAQAYTNMAAALREIGKLKEAEDAARKALAIDPKATEAMIDLADILFLSDRLSEAETLFNNATELVPDSPRLYIKLSSVLERANKMEEALEAIEKAVELNPEMPEAHQRKAMFYMIYNRIEKALEAIEKALELKPDSGLAYGTKSEILQTKGDMEEAEKVARQGLDLDPNMAFLYYAISKVKKFTKDDADLKYMQKIAQKADKIDFYQGSALNFALFKAYEDIKDYDSAFIHLKAGNDIKRKNSVYDAIQQKAVYTKIKSHFTKENLKKYENLGCEDETPVFIVGMPRSGTTLTEQIISSHPEVFGAGELHYLTTVEQELGFNENTCKEFGKSYIEMIRGINKDAKSARFITDKMPSNYLRLGQIVSALPKAKIIHCNRYPIDTCLSCYKQLFARGHYWSYNLKEMAEHYEEYVAMMDHWRNTIPDRILEINYEDTVGDFENQARKLIDYVGLEWDDACLSPHKNKRAILTASKGQVRQPVYKSSVESWRRYEQQLQPLIQPLEKYINEYPKA